MNDMKKKKRNIENVIRFRIRQHNGMPGMPKDLKIKWKVVPSIEKLEKYILMWVQKGDHVIVHAHDDEQGHVIINKTEKLKRIPDKKGEGFDKVYEAMVLKQVEAYTMSFCFTTNQDAYDIKERLKKSGTKVYYTWTQHIRKLGDWGVKKENGKYIYDPSKTDKNIHPAPKDNPSNKKK